MAHNISLSSISFPLISLSALPNTLFLSLLPFFFPSIESCSLLFDTKFSKSEPPTTTPYSLYNRSNGSLILFLFDCETDYSSNLILPWVVSRRRREEWRRNSIQSLSFKAMAMAEVSPEARASPSKLPKRVSPSRTSSSARSTALALTLRFIIQFNSIQNAFHLLSPMLGFFIH